MRINAKCYNSTKKSHSTKVQLPISPKMYQELLEFCQTKEESETKSTRFGAFRPICIAEYVCVFANCPLYCNIISMVRKLLILLHSLGCFIDPKNLMYKLHYIHFVYCMQSA